MALLLLADLNKASADLGGESSSSEVRLAELRDSLLVEGVLEVLRRPLALSLRREGENLPRERSEEHTSELQSQ